MPKLLWKKMESGSIGLETQSCRMAVGSVLARWRDELVGVASPITVDGEQLYFITIQSDRVGEKLTFRTADGQWLDVQINNPYGEADRSTKGRKEIVNNIDSHIGSLESPVVLTPADNDNVYKIIENEHVVIIRDGKRYDITGQKMEN